VQWFIIAASHSFLATAWPSCYNSLTVMMVVTKHGPSLMFLAH